MAEDKQFVDWFLQAAPYIHAHRGRTFVLQIGGDVIESKTFPHLIHDLALLNSLAIRLVVVFGARPQIDRLLENSGMAHRYNAALRITSKAAMHLVRQAVGDIRIQIESSFSMGIPNSTMAESNINVASGNYVIGRPIGVLNGIDLQMTGRVRKINKAMINSRLEAGEIVLIPPLGYSLTGEVFNLSSFEVAACAAIDLQADKLIMVGQQPVIQDAAGKTIKQITCEQARMMPQPDNASDVDATKITALAHGIKSCEAGVKRIHYIDQQLGGELLLELFSRDGVGTLLSDLPFDSIHKATAEDIGGILELIRPLEEKGILVKRSREKIEMDIKDYIILVRDGAVIACAALHDYPEDKVMELACLAVHPNYQHQSMGHAMLKFVEKLAREHGAKSLILLTTQTEHWFIEKGFKQITPKQLPVEKKQMYNFQRNSKALIKDLNLNTKID